MGVSRASDPRRGNTDEWRVSGCSDEALLGRGGESLQDRVGGLLDRQTDHGSLDCHTSVL